LKDFGVNLTPKEHLNKTPQYSRNFTKWLTTKEKKTFLSKSDVIAMEESKVCSKWREIIKKNLP